MLQNLFIAAIMILIVYNLGAGLYYMLTDRGRSDRMVNALTRRIGLSVLLILLLLIGIATGFVQPHGVGG